MSRAAKITLLVIIAIATAAVVWWCPVADWIRATITWVRGTGALGVIVFSLVFIAISVALLPTLEMYLAAGMLYGTLWGALLMNTLGLVVELCTLAIIHTSLRERIEPMIAHRPKLKALDRVIRRSFPFLILVRFSPLLPFGLVNYALAMTKIPLWRRLVANFLGMLPCTLMVTYLGSFLSSVTQLSQAEPPSLWKHVAIWSGVVATVAAAVIAARATKHALAEDPSGSRA